MSNKLRKRKRTTANNQAGIQTQTAEPDYSEVPLDQMCEGIMILINALKDRGEPIRDFDNKDKVVDGIKIIGGKPYFLAVKETDNEQ